MRERPANRLINETSPYLLQHAYNAVDWYPWGDEAFQRARDEDKPVFLSIGYSACHWCHVMERESFENDEIGALLSESFVSIKVDREERPDIDSIYMQAVQMLTGHGGWPMSMFLRPDGVPFFGGTYFPPEDRYGVPGFKRLLAHITSLYMSNPEAISSAAEQIREAVARPMRGRGGSELSDSGLKAAARSIALTFDRRNGGFGGAPKFPPAMALEFLLERATIDNEPELLDIVLTTLRKMAMGGIYDQIGGGFHRYSVDDHWLVPHFEKMLYDNALLARIYIHAFQKSGDPLFERIAKETLDFVIREMTSPEGAFYSTLDADSEGEEGKFYVWQRREVLDILGEEDGAIFCELYDVTDRGNWEHTNILNMPETPEAVARRLGIEVERLLEVSVRGRAELLAARERRIRPGRDEKILASWNGWMMVPFAEAALLFDDETYLETAQRAADFVLEVLASDGRLLRTFKDGRAHINGLLEDYAGVAWGLTAVFEATQEVKYLDGARQFARTIVDRFSDPEDGGFFDTSDDHEKLITRPKDLFDNATPSGNSLAIEALLKLSAFFGDQQLREAAERAVAAIWPVGHSYPSGSGFFLNACGWLVGSPKEIVVAGDGELFETAAKAYVPHRALARAEVPIPLTEGKMADSPTAWVCRDFRCEVPAQDAETLKKQLAG